MLTFNGIDEVLVIDGCLTNQEVFVLSEWLKDPHRIHIQAPSQAFTIWTQL